MSFASSTITQSSPEPAAMSLGDYVGAHSGAALSVVVQAIASASIAIARKIRLAGLSDTYGALGTENVQGEQQQKLDVFANELLTASLGKVASVAAIISEEDEVPVYFRGPGSETHPDAPFVVLFDPLDGSSNIDVNVNVGTIFSILASLGDIPAAALKPGHEQIAAGYVLYGPSTVFVLALSQKASPAKAGVAIFTLDDAGQFLLTTDNVRMPVQGPYYSANEANAAGWPETYRAFLRALLGKELNGQAYSARYIGSLVADFHRTLLKGGVFFYPPTAKSPEGKLRMLYEARPLALIAELAGGAATNGASPILSLPATAIHQRCSLVIGSRAEVEALQQRAQAAEAK